MKKITALFFAWAMVVLPVATLGALGTNLDSVTVGSYLYPKANGTALGSSSYRWNAYVSALHTSLGSGALYSSGGDLAVLTSVSSTELGYLDGVTSAIQTQLDGKQTLDATLTALAALDSSAGFLAQTGADSFSKRTLSATAPINISNGTGAGGNPAITCDVASGSQPGCLSSADWTTFNSKQAAGNYVTALTGDVTASGPGSVAATIANDAVSNAKMANMANSTVKCRTTAGTGDPEDCTATQTQAIVGSVVQKLAEQTTPSAPASGFMNIYPKSDGKLYKQTSAGVETEVGSGSGAGAFNIAALDTAASSWAATKQTNSDAETSVGDWVAYADAAATTPVDMTGGSPNTTCTRNTSSPINGTGDFKMTVTTGATRQGEGCSLVVNIPTAYRGQAIRVVAPYTTTGTISQGDIVPYAYDVTNGALLAPSTTVSGIISSAGTVYFTIAPQASAAQLRIGWHIARASNTGAVTVNWDDFKVEPDLNQANVPMSDWVAWTPTGSWNTNVTYTGYWRRVGDQLEADVKISLSGAPNNTALSITFPNGLTLDSSKITSQTTGYGHLLDNGSRVYDACITTNSSTSIAVNYCDGATNALSTTNPFTWASGDAVYAHFSVPISGWSSGGGTSPILSLTDWQSFTPTGSWSTNTTHSGRWRRVGDSMQIQQYIVLSGAPTSAAFTENLPSGYVVDTTKLATTTNAPPLMGNCTIRDDSATNPLIHACVVRYNNTTSVRVDSVTASGTASNDVEQVSSSANKPITFANNDSIFLNYFVPISGWTSTSSGTLTAPRSEITVDSGNGHGSTATKYRRFSNTRKSTGPAITYADSSTNGASFTVNEAGIYSISYSDASSTTTDIAISVNDSVSTTSPSSTTYAQGLRAEGTSPVASYPANVAWTGYLAAGDVVRAKTDGSANVSDQRCMFSITKVSN